MIRRRSRGIRRQPDQWTSAHERATARAAERLDWPLETSEATWLDRHLADCEPCSEIAAAYEEQASGLRGLLEQAPPPPRDLWARTAAAIEVESRRRAPRRAARPRLGALPLGALSGALVVAVIFGASLLQTQPRPVPPSSPIIAAPLTPRPTVQPGVTPFPVARVDDVAWLAVNSRGEGELFQAGIDEVCPEAGTTGCAPLDGSGRRSLDLDEPPLALVQAPDDGELVVVEAGAADAGGAVFVVPAGTPFPSGTPGPTPTPTATLTATPTDSVSPSVPPTGSPTPTTPVGGSPSASVSPTVPPTSSPSTSPSLSPAPSPPVAGAIAIATDVILVGEVGYSRDGAWFAFSAKPADGSAGPDVFVWRAGDPSARPITTDHASVFSSWLGDRVLASRLIDLDPTTNPDTSPSAAPSASPTNAGPAGSPTSSPAPTPRIVRSEAILIDPATAEAVSVGTGFWRPIVDPSGQYAVYFDGPLALEADGFGLRPAFGQLVLGAWPDEPATEPDASGSPRAGSAASPGITASASPAPSASMVATARPDPAAQVVETGTIADWDARWDATGTRLAVWVTDGVDPSIGRLNLFRVDRLTGRLEVADRPVANVPALRGFSIADGRLAWVTPPGQDGEGSRVQIIAWSAREFGSVETLPAEDRIVVIR